MPFNFGSLLDSFRKLSPVPLLALAMAATAMLFAPDAVLVKTGVMALREDYKGWIGTTFWLAWAFLAAHAVWGLVAKMRSWLQTREEARARLGMLRSLTTQEKDCLLPYIRDQKSTNYFEPDDGVAAGLRAKGILYRPTDFIYRHSMAYNLKTWARDVLNEHPDLLGLDHAPKKRKKTKA